MAGKSASALAGIGSGTDPNSAPATAPAPDTDLYVIDTSTSGHHDGATDARKRRHEVLVGGAAHVWAFVHGHPTKMPRADGLKFLRAKGFIVKDQSGRTLGAVTDPLSLEQGAGVALAPDQVVANLRELTMPALLARANVLDGGEKFGGNSARDEIVAFLVEARRKALPPAPGRAAAAARVMDESTAPESGDHLPPEDFERLFGAAEA